MSQVKHFDRIAILAIVAIIVAILFGTILLNTTYINDIQAPSLPRSASTSNNEPIHSAGPASAEFSDALALQSAHQVADRNSEANLSVGPASAEFFEALALALQHGRRDGDRNSEVTLSVGPAGTEFSDTLALQRAHLVADRAPESAD